MSHQPGRVITIDTPPHVFGDAPGLGRCELRPVSGQAETELARSYRRPFAADYHRFVTSSSPAAWSHRSSRPRKSTRFLAAPARACARWP